MLLKTTQSQKEFTLQDLLANLELLYVKAKNFHWNVHGPEFRPLHKTFDEIQEVALEWSDTIGERMRALDIHVDATAASYLESLWYPEGKKGMDAGQMKEDMSLTLVCISKHLMNAINKKYFDEVTSNLLQDLCAQIDKQNYFVKSSI